MSDKRANQFEPGNGAGHKFQPGKSGNPGGLTKEQAALARMLGEECRRITIENLPRVAKILKNAKTPPLIFIKALEFVADRGFGKPKQAVEHSGPDGGPIETKDVTDEDRAKALMALLGKVGKK